MTRPLPGGYHIATCLLAAVLLLGCERTTAPRDIIVTCVPLYLVVGFAGTGDTLWTRAARQVQCSWLDRRTGEGGPGTGP